MAQPAAYRIDTLILGTFIPQFSETIGEKDFLNSIEAMLLGRQFLGPSVDDLQNATHHLICPPRKHLIT